MVEYWLSHLAGTGAREVFILTHDRPEALETVVGTGARWGLKTQLIEETRELTRTQAFANHEQLLGSPASKEQVFLMDRFPGETTPIFGSFQQLYNGLVAWMPKATTPDRVGVSERHSQVWSGLNCDIAPSVELHPPCWIGRNVHIGPQTVLGPGTIIEDGAFIEGVSSISESCIGPGTFVGQCSELSRSLALGETLVNMESGLVVKVPDSFVLSSLRQPRPQQAPVWFARLAELCCRNKAEAQLLWKHLLINRGS